jgi:hypothetical protein
MASQYWPLAWYVRFGFPSSLKVAPMAHSMACTVGHVMLLLFLVY